MPRKRNLQDDLVEPLQDTKQNTIDPKKTKPRSKKKTTNVPVQEVVQEVEKVQEVDVVQQLVQKAVKKFVDPKNVESAENMNIQMDTLDDDVDCNEALQIVRNYETCIPRIINDSISTVLPKDSKYAGDLKSQNILLKTQLQTLAQDYQELQTKFNILQSSGVKSASMRFEELKNSTQERFTESEKTIHLLQKENEKLKFELENPSGLVIPKETQLKLTELESLVQQLQTKDELNQETLVALLNDKKELEANVVRLQSTHNDLISTNNDKNAEMEKVQVVLNDLEKKYKNTKQELDTLKMCDFETKLKELEESCKEDKQYTTTLERIMETYESLTGIKVKGITETKRNDEDGKEHDYIEFQLKHKGNSRSLFYKLLVPKEKNLPCAYIPESNTKGLPDFLDDEIEFETVMTRKFFWGVYDFLNKE